jgi:hypothetical protein
MKIKIKRTGEIVTFKEFFKRWKQGTKEVTPYQHSVIDVIGFITVLIGITWGIIYSLMLKQWWLSVILTGSFIVSGNALWNSWKKMKILRKIDKEMRGIENEQESTS